MVTQVNAASEGGCEEGEYADGGAEAAESPAQSLYGSYFPGGSHVIHPGDCVQDIPSTPQPERTSNYGYGSG